MRAYYEQTMKEWLGCEAIVKQREGEKHAEAIAKCNSVASVDRPGPVQRDSTISTDVSGPYQSHLMSATHDRICDSYSYG